MLGVQQLAQRLKDTIKGGDSLKFEKLLAEPQIYLHSSLLKILSDILASGIFSLDEKKIASSAINFVFRKRIDQNYKQWLDRCWEEYFDCLIERESNDLIEWPFVVQTINGLSYLIEEIYQSDQGYKTIEKFNTTSLMGKLMLTEAVKRNSQVSIENQFVFMREIIENLIKETRDLVLSIHSCNQVAYDRLVMEHDAMTCLYEWLAIISQDNYTELHKQFDTFYVLAKYPPMVELLQEQLKAVILIRSNRISYRISQNLVEFYDEDTAQLCRQNSSYEKILKIQLNIKSSVLNIICDLASSYQSTADMDQFDTYPVLSFIELLTPIIITELDQNKTIKEYHLKNIQFCQKQFTQLTTSLFMLLKKAADFMFLLQVFTQTQTTILYSLFHTYMITTEQQKEAFYNDGEEFYALNEQFIQKDLFDTCEIPKQACGQFLKAYLKLNNKAHAEYIEFLAISLNYQLLPKQQQKHQSSYPIINSALQKGYPIPSVEFIYLILTKIFFFSDKTNQDFIKFIFKKFLQPKFVFNFKGIQKTRVLMFLNYFYGIFFGTEGISNQGAKYIEWGSIKPKYTSQLLYLMDLLQTALKNGFAQNVIDFITNEMQKTERQEIFLLALKLIRQKLLKIPVQKLLMLTQKVCARARAQFTSNKQKYTSKSLSDSLVIYRCFAILEEISEQEELISQNLQLLKQIVRIIDFFNEQRLELYEFGTKVMDLLSNVVKLQQVIPIQFQRYLKNISNLVASNKSFDSLLQTYYLILLKGRETFEQHPKFLNKIKQDIQQKILTRNLSSNHMVIQALFLLDNILLVYPHLALDNCDIFEVTNKIFQAQKQSTEPDSQLCASILLYWAASQYAFGDKQLYKLSECKIQIFKDQFGLMFALTLHRLIEKYYETPSLQHLLKLALKLLDFQHYHKNQRNYKGPSFVIPLFKKYLQLDSFQQISQALQFLRQKLPRDQYTKCIEMLKNQIGGDVLSKLLSIRVINNRVERNIVIVKKL